MNDWNTLLEMLRKVPYKVISINEELKTIEIYDYDRGSIIFMFDDEGNLKNWE